MEALQHNADLMMLLATQVGNINMNGSRDRVAFPYLRARVKLATSLYEIAQEYSITRHWDEANAIMQENIRLCHLHLTSYSVRDWCLQFATQLLHSGRIDDATSFSQYVHHRITVHSPRALAHNIRTRRVTLGNTSTSTRSSTVKGSSESVRLGNTISTVKGSIEGDWIYPRSVPRDRLEAMATATTVNDSDDEKNGCSYLFFVMYLAKLKKLMVFTFVRQAIDSFQQTYVGQRIDDGPLSIILEYIVPFPLVEITTYEAFLGSCNELHSELVGMTRGIRERNHHLFGIMKKGLKNNWSANGLVFVLDGEKGTSSGKSEKFAHDTVRQCLFSLRTMPQRDLDIWLKYCCDGDIE